MRPPSHRQSSSAARVIVVRVTNASIHEAAPLNHAAGRKEGKRDRPIGDIGRERARKTLWRFAGETLRSHKWRCLILPVTVYSLFLAHLFSASDHVIIADAMSSNFLTSVRNLDYINGTLGSEPYSGGTAMPGRLVMELEQAPKSIPLEK